MVEPAKEQGFRTSEELFHIRLGETERTQQIMAMMGALCFTHP